MDLDEIWKDIDGYNDYQISNLGRIKSLKFNKEKIKKLKLHKTGYIHVNLSNNGVKKTLQVHRLVGKMFLDNFDELKVINHIDFNKSNNIVTNLQCVTHSENCKHYHNVIKEILYK